MIGDTHVRDRLSRLGLRFYVERKHTQYKRTRFILPEVPKALGVGVKPGWHSGTNVDMATGPLVRFDPELLTFHGDKNLTGRAFYEISSGHEALVSFNSNRWWTGRKPCTNELLTEYEETGRKIVQKVQEIQRSRTLLVFGVLDG